MTGADQDPTPAVPRTARTGAPPAWTQAMYSELHRIARRHLRGAADVHTLQATGLLHEAYMKLAGCSEVEVRDRVHFAALVSQVMRQILVDHARSKLAERHGAGRERVSVSAVQDDLATTDYDVLALDEALRELAELNATKARLVELRFFAGLTENEAAEAIGMSRAEATRQWRMTRAWLAQRLRD